MLRYIFAFVFLGALFAHSRSGHFFGIDESELQDGIHLETIMMNDTARSRLVPIAIYTSYADTLKDTLPVVIFNHGYGKNQGDSYLSYSYINEHLASKGYCVVSIQHEVKTDEPLPMKGNLTELRMPFWNQGVDNIQFVVNQLDSLKPKLNFQNMTMVGHSNGGDIACHFTTLHPDSVNQLITLDNLRYALPLNGSVSVLSIRASNTVADTGVLPSLENQEKYNVKIIKLANTLHREMNDKATDIQREEINREVAYFLNSKL